MNLKPPALPPRKVGTWTMKKNCLAFALVAMAFTTVEAQNYQLHSVFVFSFTRYVQWPEEASQGDFEINVLGDSPIVAELKKMSESKKVGDRAIKITKLASAAEIKKCHILFLPADRSGDLSEVLAKLGTSATLVVTEQPGVGAKGSSINFIEKDGKLAFEINQNALSKQRLKASNELLRYGIVI